MVAVVWSVATEFHMYFITPPLIYVFYYRRSRGIILVFSLMLLSLLLRYVIISYAAPQFNFSNDQKRMFTYVFFMSRLNEYCLGILTYFVWLWRNEQEAEAEAETSITNIRDGNYNENENEHANDYTDDSSSSERDDSNNDNRCDDNNSNTSYHTTTTSDGINDSRDEGVRRYNNNSNTRIDSDHHHNYEGNRHMGRYLPSLHHALELLALSLYACFAFSIYTYSTFSYDRIYEFFLVAAATSALILACTSKHAFLSYPCKVVLESPFLYPIASLSYCGYLFQTGNAFMTRLIFPERTSMYTFTHACF